MELLDVVTPLGNAQREIIIIFIIVCFYYRSDVDHHRHRDHQGHQEGILHCRPRFPAGDRHCHFKLQPCHEKSNELPDRWLGHHHRKREIPVHWGPFPAFIPRNGGDCLAIMWVLQFGTSDAMHALESVSVPDAREIIRHQSLTAECCPVFKAQITFEMQQHIIFKTLKYWKGFNESFALRVQVYVWNI